MMKADKDVDARYEYLRGRHGEKNPMANGYRLSGFFLREQNALLAALDKNNGPFLDVACGSGLMLAPLLDEGHIVYGLDFNDDACIAAYGHGLGISRGDAFNMPFADNTIGQIVNCQFLNQQSAAQTQIFINEAARILKPGGQLIILWRHAQSWIHIVSHSVFTVMDKFTGQPPFPQYTHPMAEMRRLAAEAGLQVEKQAVTLPFLKPDMIAPDRLVSNVIGASLFIVLKKL